MADFSDNRFEILPGLVREWYDGEGVLILTLSAMSKTIADAWAAELRAIFTSQTADRPIHYIHDTSQLGISAFTPTIRKRVEDAIRQLSDRRGKTAIVLNQPVVAEFIGVFLRLQRQGQRQRRIFPNRDRALEWVRK